MDLQNNFTYHAPTPKQVEQYSAIREMGHALATLIQDTCPKSREQSLALTNVEQAVMWANASIARNED